DGTPVANTIADLKAGRTHASIDKTELGFSHSFDPPYPDSALAWVGAFGTDCEGWTATMADDGAAITGWVGSTRSVGPYWHTTIPLPCSRRYPIYCIQVGSGAGPNRVSQVPAGAKIAFVSTRSYHGDFAAQYVAKGGVIADGGGDAAHSAADAICN